jgi:two-component system, NtrC family, response regulator
MYSSTILLVKPEPESRTRVRARLEGSGYKVVEAADTATAMSMLNRSEIALVVTELYLPVANSRCLARTIGKSPALRRTKVLAYTTHGKAKDRAWARRIGARGYVITRSGEERLFQVVDHLMQKPMGGNGSTASAPHTA